MSILKSIFKYKNEILFLSIQNVKIRYLQTVFGISWAIIQPLTYVFTLWFFFVFGLRTGDPINELPFIIFLFSGYMMWNFITTVVTSGSKIFQSNALLVKTIKFPVLALPLINVLSNLYVHIGVMFFVIGIFILNGATPDIYYINIIYYLFTSVVFLTAFTFLISTISIMIKDLPMLVNSIMMPMFWLTPVMWEATGLLKIVMMIINPFYYFVLGYQDTFVYKHFFWETPIYDVYIWLIIEILLLVGLKLYHRLRPIMADVI